jgi:hypothetical protein
MPLFEPDDRTQSHVKPKRLHEIAQKETRLTQEEFDHLDSCQVCLTNYARSILQTARMRAQDKIRKPAVDSAE